MLGCLRLLLISADSVLNMLNGSAADERDIETYIWPRPVIMLGKRRVGGLKKPRLLARQYRISRLCKAFAGFYFNENQGRGIGCDEVDLSSAGAQTLRQYREAFRLPVFGNNAFGDAALRFRSPALG